MENAVQIDLMSNLTSNCQNTLEHTFFLLSKNDTVEEEITLAHYYYSKLLFDSSTNVNDLSSYSNCMERNHQYDFTNFTRKPINPVYLIVFVDNREYLLEYFKSNIRTSTYLVGVCFVMSCTESDHKELLSKIMNLTGLLNANEFNKLKIFSLANTINSQEGF